MAALGWILGDFLPFELKNYTTEQSSFDAFVWVHVVVGVKVEYGYSDLCVGGGGGVRLNLTFAEEGGSSTS